MVERAKYRISGLVILFLICWVGSSPLACNSTEIWSDNFNDGDHTGWTICENEVITSGSNWSATNHYLQLDQSGWGIISHPSNVAYGTWSFDIKTSESSDAEIVFISNNITDLDTFSEWTGYWINFIASSENLALSLRKQYEGDWSIVGSYATPIPAAGWHHIEVTRTTTGQFTVMHNGSLIIQEVDIDIDTSEMFAVYVENWQMIDNIIVDNEVQSSSIDLILIAIVTSTVAIIAVLIIILRRK